MEPEDPEDDVPLSELIKLHRRREEELRPTGVKVEPELMAAVWRVHSWNATCAASWYNQQCGGRRT